MYRFAVSEGVYLFKLRNTIRDICHDVTPLSELGLHIPLGKLDSPPILHSLINALEFRGPHSRIFDAIQSDPGGSHLDRDSGIQSEVLRLLRPEFSDDQLGTLLARKCVVTLGEDCANLIRMKPDWFSQISEAFGHVKAFIRICWLKSIAGAWTTTHRMHEDLKWPCIFGCLDAQDNFRHYVVCPVLWNLAGLIFDNEGSIAIEERLCLVSPSVIKLQRLALAHSIYHACKNDTNCTVHGIPASPLIVQSRGAQFTKALKHLIV